MQTPKIRTWSFSRLKDFEKCRLMAKLKYVDRIPEHERPLPEGKLEHANDRGTRVHLGAEEFVKGNADLILELKRFEKELKVLRTWYKEGKVSLEGEWALDKEWKPCGWGSPEAWLRLKCDVFVRVNERHGIVIDYKTGRKYGNEIKHAEQVQLYQLVCFILFPELERVDVELWYTDQNDITHMEYTKEAGLKFFDKYHAAAVEMTECEEFPPNPNSFSCKWCPYGPAGTGHCDKGYVAK